MIIWSEFRMEQYWVDDHKKNAPQFNIAKFKDWVDPRISVDSGGAREHAKLLIGWIILSMWFWESGWDESNWIEQNEIELNWMKFLETNRIDYIQLTT